jgi:hypothetical protein
MKPTRDYPIVVDDSMTFSGLNKPIELDIGSWGGIDPDIEICKYDRIVWTTISTSDLAIASTRPDLFADPDQVHTMVVYVVPNDYEGPDAYDVDDVREVWEPYRYQRRLVLKLWRISNSDRSKQSDDWHLGTRSSSPKLNRILRIVTRIAWLSIAALWLFRLIKWLWV